MRSPQLAAIRLHARPNPALNTDVPHAGAARCAPRSVPPVSSIPLGIMYVSPGRRQIARRMVFAALLLTGCADPRSPAFEPPSVPIAVPVLSSAMHATLVKDERTNDQKVTSTIREFSTTTLTLGDDMLSPAAPVIFASKLLEQGAVNELQTPVVLRIFLVSVWGRSPRLPSQTSMPLFLPHVIVFLPVALPAQTNEDVRLPEPPSGYSADLLSVSVSGEVAGVEFSAKETLRLDGKVNSAQIRELVNLVATDAANKAVAAARTKATGIER